LTDWNEKYINKNTGWDIGIISKPIKKYIDQLNDKNTKILIPGCGNSYEAEYLHNKGFNNVYVIDIAEKAIDNFKSRVPSFPKNHLILGNFFTLKDKFDLIIEQTFYCAINPKKRDEYVKKMNNLLKPKGKLVGLLFQFPLTEQGPPFGGSKTEYLNRFSKYFKIEILEDSYNSIESRQNKEVFIKFVKKQ
jgi:thiopurine S-methyltransferase